MVYQSLFNVALIHMSIGLYLQKLHDIGVIDSFFIFGLRSAGLNFCRYRGLILACKQALILHRVDLPFKLPDAPRRFGTFVCIEVTDSLVGYLHKYAIM